MMFPSAGGVILSRDEAREVDDIARELTRSHAVSGNAAHFMALDVWRGQQEAARPLPEFEDLVWPVIES
jgi:hypothetical protein